MWTVGDWPSIKGWNYNICWDPHPGRCETQIHHLVEQWQLVTNFLSAHMSSLSEPIVAAATVLTSSSDCFASLPLLCVITSFWSGG